MKLIKNTFLKYIFGAKSQDNFKVDGAAYINEDYFVTQLEFSLPISENVKVAERIKLDSHANYEVNAKIIYEF